jgi:hypothetical protein
MKYILCCGTCGDPPRQLTVINGEPLVERTIRLLWDNGVRDIVISSMEHAFDKYGRLEYDSSGGWINCFAPMEEPACYIFGDVFFSYKAIETIVNTETDSIEFFASAPPFADNYPKAWAEPFAFKVADQKRFREAIEKTRELWQQGQFKRHPIAWELWQVIKGTPLNEIDYTNYTVINDYTCDVDYPGDEKQWIF